MRPTFRSSGLSHQVIHIQPLAAAKPPMGAPCNGCGLCCLAEPCPLGVLLSRSRSGPCKALQWVPVERQYRCGALFMGRQGGAFASSLPWQWLHQGLARMRALVVARWIAAGSGCDCDLEAAASITMDSSSPTTSHTRHD